MVLEDLIIKIDPRVDTVFSRYPNHVLSKIGELRGLILESATELEEVNSLEETLKWGEPSYLTKTGSTIRIDWKEKAPEKYAVYFKCTSKLIPTFKELFGDIFSYEGNRAIVFRLDEEIPRELKTCIKSALLYHKVKDLDLLGCSR